MNPYQSLESRAFWAPAVGQREMMDINDLWRPKFDIAPNMRTATFGSCFAQHFAAALRDRGFSWMEAEAPPPRTPPQIARRYNYGVFSARTGNIYTTSLLLQWLQWAIGHSAPPDEVWEQDGRFFDPFRPAIEPNGFISKDELRASRQLTLGALRRIMRNAELFVFTLGLTESWRASNGTHEYPMCPGTVAGEFDPAQHHFVNQDYPFVQKHLQAALDLIESVNPSVRVLLTVSPVPLTATNSGNHVLVATTESKSILRAVAGATARARDNVDYFPSYEIINSAPFRGAFFESNQRSVGQAGVAHVMSQFFAGLGDVKAPFPDMSDTTSPEAQSMEDAACEEALLEAEYRGRSAT